MSDTRGPRIVTFGEVLLRLSPPGVERFFQTPLLRTFWGGAEANVSAGAASLGAMATHVTVLPDNPLGDGARRALQAEGVDLSHARTTPGRMGLYFLEAGADIRPLSVTYDRADSAFASMRGDEFPWPAILAGAHWFHVSGVTAALGDGPYAAVLAAVNAAHALGVPVSLDLNYRPALWAGRDPRPLMQPLAERAQLLIGNPGAIELMLGISTAGTIPEPVPAIADTIRAVHTRFACAQVAVTQREVVSSNVHRWQAHLWDASANAVHSAPCHTVTLVDRVGGGDAFAAALLVELARGTAHDAALRFATAASALKLTIPGDFNRVTRADVERALASST